jgi:hypothetical protein
MDGVSKAGRPGARTPRAALDTCQSQLEGIVGIIIPLPMPKGQPCSEFTARRRLARLDRATSEEMRIGLELLCVLDPVGFEVALPAQRPDLDADAELGEPVAVCRLCGSASRAGRGRGLAQGPPYSPDPASGGVPPAWVVVSPVGVCSNM